MPEKIFNLLYEPWIMGLSQRGEQEELSLFSVLERSHELRCLDGELPTQDMAILGLLLAVLYSTFTRVDAGGERKPIKDANEALNRWESLWKLKCFPMEPIKKRLYFYEERFFIFHPERPFYQVAGLDCGTQYNAAELLEDLPEDINKVRLFPVSNGEQKPRITFAEAARWLLYLNAFGDTSSKPSIRDPEMPSPGAGLLGRLGMVYANGTNLFETLMLNFILLNENNEPWRDGYASWELEEPRRKERTEIVFPPDWLGVPCLQSRRLLLQREDESVIGYRLLGGDFFPKENAFTRQMALWRKDRKGDEHTPKHHGVSKQVWREVIKKPGITRWLSILKDKNIINHMVDLRAAEIK